MNPKLAFVIPALALALLGALGNGLTQPEPSAKSSVEVFSSSAAKRERPEPHAPAKASRTEILATQK